MNQRFLYLEEGFFFLSVHVTHVGLEDLKVGGRNLLMVVGQTCLVIAGSMGYTSETDGDGRRSQSTASRLGSSVLMHV